MAEKTSHDSETLAKGQQAITAVAFIHRDFNGTRKVFLPKRAATKKFLPSVFELPGGHIDFGEELVDGLKREIMEEFGMNLSVGDPFGAFTYTNEIKQSHSVELVFFAEFTDPIENIQLDPEDHSEYQWVSVDELPTVYTPTKQADDAEFQVIRKGFAILHNEGYAQK